MDNFCLNLPAGEVFPTDIVNQVLREIEQDGRQTMHTLWLNWTHLGVPQKSREEYLNKFSHFTNLFYQDVLSETTDKIEALKKQAQDLIKEAQLYSQVIPSELQLPVMTDNLALVDYHKLLQDKTNYYKKIVIEREEKLKELLDEAEELDNKMELKICAEFSADSPVPSKEALAAFEERLEVLKAERERRMQQFRQDQAEIKMILKFLKMTPETKFELTVVTSTDGDFVVSDLNMTRVAKYKQELHQKYEKTNNMVLELREKLTKVWDFVGTKEEFRETFLQTHPGCDFDTELAIRDEIARCESIKKELMKVKIIGARREIVEMWDRCLMDQEKRAQFLHYHSKTFCEDMLTLHQLYLQDLQEYYHKNQEIFDLYNTRRKLWEDLTMLEARAADPRRFRNRGGQLLQEEKERNGIATKLPKIEEQLKALVTQYEAHSGQQFLVYGKPVLDALQEDWENRKKERANKLSARKKGVTPGSAGSRRDLTNTMLPNSSRGHLTPRRTPLKRVSRLLVAASPPKRKLNLNVPKVTVNGSILKRKGPFVGRRSGGGVMSRAGESPRSGDTPRPLPAESFLEVGPRDANVKNIRDYSEFMNAISDKPVLRSSNKYDFSVCMPTRTEECKTPIHSMKTVMVTTKEESTLKKNDLKTQRTPLSARKANMARSDAVIAKSLFQTPDAKRSNTQLTLTKPKNLPPII